MKTTACLKHFVNDYKLYSYPINDRTHMINKAKKSCLPIQKSPKKTKRDGCRSLFKAFCLSYKTYYSVCLLMLVRFTEKKISFQIKLKNFI